MSNATWRLFIDLTGREIRSRFLQSGAGWFWLLITPVLLLLVYAFVFGVIFQARAPEDLQVPFAVWLAVALWPWLAFSDGVQRGSHGILQNAALVSKVAIRRELLVISAQTAAFVLQLVGYGVVLVVVHATTASLTWSGLLYAIPIIATLYLFSVGLALLLSGVQVFVRDIEQILPTLFMFWFFLTPIIYAPELLPDEIAQWIFLNPMTWWVEELRAAMFEGKIWPDVSFVYMLLTGGLALLAGLAVFRRLSSHFEDFL